MIIIKLEISYSSLSTFKKSPLEYYFYKLAKLNPEPINTCYGDAGNAVHNSVEEYIKTRNVESAEKIFSEKISKLPERGMFGEVINQSKFRGCFDSAIKIVDSWIDKGYELIPEEKFEYTTTINGVDIKIRGFMDVIAKKQDEIHILDWKTNSSVPTDGFKGQQEFYTYLYYKKYGIIPTCFHWYMLKTNNEIVHSYKKDVVEKVEKELEDFVHYIKERGMNASLYDAGEYNHPFNNFTNACNREIAKRNNVTLIETSIYRNQLIMHNIKDSKLLKSFDKLFSYPVDGHEFSEKFRSGDWDGKIHFLKYKEKDKTHSLPIGFYWMVQDFLEKFNTRFEMNYKMNFHDMKNKEVQSSKFKTKFKDAPFELRYYQKDAVAKAIEKKIGILSLGTSAGKSAIMAELIKQLNVRSLIIVNRIELVEQTADAFEEYLGVHIGRMYEGDLDIKNQITVASVQTISAILDRKENKDLITYLFNVNALLFDECQNVTDKGFYNKILKYLVNSDYIIGLSGSAWRNYEPETLSMKALVGDIIYSKTTKELEDEGFICPTKVQFLRPPENEVMGFGNYHDAYDYYITKNESRNNIITTIAEKYKSHKKILILTKLIAHGEKIQESISNSVLINSKTPSVERKKMFESFKKEKGIVLIGSQQIFSTGINVPDLDIIINASASKSSIMAIQSIGRVKRKYPGKDWGYYIDFFDSDCEIFRSGSKKRISFLENYGNDVSIVYSLEDVFNEIDCETYI